DAHRRRAAHRQPAALGAGRGRCPARARDLRRRRQVRARRHRRPDRRGEPVLPALARPPPRPRAQPAHLCLRRRGAGAHPARAAAPACGGVDPRAPAGRRAARGAVMNALATAVPTPPAASGFAAAAAKGALVASDLARDFPILSRPVRGRRLVYLDNGATTQKPEAVIEAERRFYRESNANIHRGVHWLSQHATDLYEQARERVQRLLNAASADEIVFTRGTTEAINLVAYSWGRANLKAGDEVVLTGMEHHSNIVPWQLVCEQTGAVLKVVPITDRGELRLDAYESLLGPRTRLVSVVHVSNALGTVNPVARM